MRYILTIILAAAMTTGCARVSHLKQSDPDTGERILEKTVMTSFWSVDENSFALRNTDGEESVNWARSTDGTSGPDSAINALANVGAFALTGQLRNFTPQAAPVFDSRSGFATEQPNEVTSDLMVRLEEVGQRVDMLESENSRLRSELEAMHSPE